MGGAFAEQELESYLESVGYVVFVCHGCEAAIKNMEEVTAWQT
jgi:hypothetical protein